MDVGCGSGKLGQYLINNKNCVVYGIDNSIDAIEIAKKILHRAILLDIENEELPFKDEVFDIIIFVARHINFLFFFFLLLLFFLILE